MVSLTRVQPSKRRTHGPKFVLRHDRGETQFYDPREAELAWAGAVIATHEPASSMTPLVEIVRDFVKEHAASYSKSTINGFRYHASFLVEAFGDRSIDRITIDEILKLHVQLQSHESETVAPAAINLMSRLMHFAMEHGLVTPSSCFEVPRLPLPVISSARRVRSRYKPNLPGLNAIETMLSHPESEAGLFASIGVLQGLRCGETLGLDWDAIDWTSMEIDVHQSFGAHGDGEVKTMVSSRILPMTAHVGKLLRRAHQAAGFPKRGPVFVNTKGRRMSYESMVLRYYHWQCSIGLGQSHSYRLESTGKLKWHFEEVWPSHTLRHVAAALMIRAGMPDVDIQAWLGHVHLDETLETYAYFFHLHEAGFDVLSSSEYDHAQLQS